MNEIRLLGVAHGDVDVSENMERTLAIEQPSVITVELHKSQEEGILKSPTQLALELRVRSVVDRLGESARQLLDLVIGNHGQEFYSAIRYAKEHGLPYYLIDALIEDPFVKGTEELISLSDEELLLRVTASLDEHRKLYRNLYRRMELLQEINDVFIETPTVDQTRCVLANQRDTTPAAALQDLRKQHTGKILHICGAVHTLNDAQGETLFSILLKGDLNVTRELVVHE
jgi:pheromone shutdown protein TraB